MASLEKLDGARTIISLTDVTQPLNRHRLDDVGDALRDRGIADLVVLPYLAAVRDAWNTPEVLAQPAGVVAGGANRLAHSITSALGQQGSGAH
ncbi:hypothetical protein AB0J43_07450 [Nonomuraea fuscirosea]